LLMTTARKLPILSTSVALSLRIMVELKQMVRKKHLREAPAAMQLVIFLTMLQLGENTLLRKDIQ